MDIRPPFQREFVYKEKQRNAVIETINKRFPLNVMYWAGRLDGTYEIIDGQQRTISIAQYVHNQFSLDEKIFDNLSDDEQRDIQDYELMVYVCNGKDSEKLNWFKTINIAGETLTSQELRNAVYAGPWVADAKRYFSKNGCVASKSGGSYVSGSPIRQEYLEKAIRWASQNNIEKYMSEHQQDPDAEPLWEHFKAVIRWVETVFVPRARSKYMKTVDWGTLYRDHKDKSFNPEDTADEVLRLFDDEDVTNQTGIYSYVITGKERYLNVRSFPKATKQRVYNAQKGRCAQCSEEFELSKMEADHITPWVEGGKTIEENCQILCREHNRRKATQ